MRHSELTPFETVTALHKHLQDRGYRISLSAIYKHVRLGRLAKHGDGKFHADDIETYVAACLKRTLKGGEIGALQREKLKQEVKKLRVQTERAQTAHRREKGELLERVEVERAFAGRALLFRADLETTADEIALRLLDQLGLGMDRQHEIRQTIWSCIDSTLKRYAEPDRAWTVHVPREDTP